MLLITFFRQFILPGKVELKISTRLNFLLLNSVQNYGLKHYKTKHYVLIFIIYDMDLMEIHIVIFC